MELKNFYAQDANGNIIPNATCTMYLADSSTLATGLQDENGDPLPNPFTANINGLIAVAAPQGTFDLEVYRGTNTGKIRIQFIDVDQVAADATVASSSATAAAASATAASASATQAATYVANLSNTTNPLLGSALIPTVGRVVDSIAAIRALPTAGSKTAFATGYRPSILGGGGPYFQDPTDTTSADNGGTILVAGDGMRWKLQYSGAVCIRQFGCHPTLSDNTAFLQAALNSLVPLTDVGGTYLIEPVTFPAAVGAQFNCAGVRKTIFQARSANTTLFAYAGPVNTAADSSRIGNFSIKAHASGSTLPALKTTGFRDSVFYSIEGLSTSNNGFYSLIDNAAWPYLAHKNELNNIRLDDQTGWTKVIDFNTGGSGDGINNANIYTINEPWIVGNVGLTHGIDCLRSAQTKINGGLIEGCNGATYVNMGNGTDLNGVWLEFYAGQTGKHLDFNNAPGEGQANNGHVEDNYFFPAVVIDYHNSQVRNLIGPKNNFSGGVTFVNNPGGGTANLYIDVVEQYNAATPAITFVSGITGTLMVSTAVQTENISQFTKQQSFTLTYNWSPSAAGPSKFQVDVPSGFSVLSMNASALVGATGAPLASSSLGDGSFWIGNTGAGATSITVFVTYIKP